MSKGNPYNPDKLPNHLGWQGWQLDLPYDWNPARLAGTDRTGGLIVADLEGPRLEITWKTVRRTTAVDLSRLTARAKRGQPEWSVMPVSELGRGMICGYRSVAADGTISMMLLSGISHRLALLKLTPSPQAGREGSSALLLEDTPVEEACPWCVYGFAWTVPAGFRLIDRSFAPGHTRVEFRDRRQGLTFQRWALAGVAPEGNSACSPVAIPGLRSHNGHDLRIRSLPANGLWGRLRHTATAEAEWVCPLAQRRYRVSSSGPQPLAALETSIQEVVCHR
jgi:hypothetical protein